MKTINVTAVKVIEVVLRPNEEMPLAVAFELLDEGGQVVTAKRVVVKSEDLPLAASNAIANLVEKITNRLTTLEGV